MSYSTDILQNYYKIDTDSRYLKVHKWNQESYSDNFKDLLPNDKNAKILEIGVGAGQLLFFLKNMGYKDIEGADIGEEQVKFLEGMDIKGSTISSISDFLKGKDNYYDAIIMNQVIEHLSKEELWESLHAIRSALKTGAPVILATPNMACVSGLFQRYVDFTHQTGFTERSAYQIMKIAGFKDLMIRGDRIRLKLRPKRVVWWLCNKLWYALLGFIYYVEKGMDRPKILSRDLIIMGKK